MTVLTTASDATLTADGVVAAFTTPFTCSAATHARIGILSPGLVERLDVTRTLNASGTVTLTLSAAPVSGTKVYLWRDTARTQQAPFRDLSSFPAAQTETALDLLTRVAQEHGRDLGRTMRAPAGEMLAELPAATARAGRILSFDASTGAPQLATLTSLPVPLASETADGLLAKEDQRKLNGKVSIYDYLTPAQIAEVEGGMTAASGPITVAVQGAIDAISASGGGIIELPYPALTWWFTAPIEVKSNVIIDAPPGTVWKKTNATVSRALAAPFAAFGEKNCVIFIGLASRFGVRNVKTVGDRVVTGNLTTGAWTDTASVGGLYCFGASNFHLSAVEAEDVLDGIHIAGSIHGWIDRPKTLLAKARAFRLTDSCTSLTIDSPLAYASAQAWDISNSVYCTINAPANDLINMGKRPFGAAASGDDPWPGSGGDWQTASYIFSIGGSKGIVINSPGVEHAYANFLYAEASDVVINAPYIVNIRSGNANWRLVELRGTAPCFVTINNPSGLSSIVNGSSATRAFWVETPATQTLTLTGAMRVAAVTADTAISDGVVHTGARTLLDLHAGNMVEGVATPFRKTNAGDTLAVTVANEQCVLRMRANASGAGPFFLTFPPNITAGFFLLRSRVALTNPANVARWRWTEVNASGGAVAFLTTIFGPSGTLVDVTGWRYLSVGTGNRIRLDAFCYDTNEIIDVQSLEVVWVPNP